MAPEAIPHEGLLTSAANGEGESELPVRRGSVARRRAGHLLAVVLIAAFTLIFHYRQVLHGEIPRWPEQTQYESMRAYDVRALRAGHVPVWSPDLGIGMPIMALSDDGTFYPLHLVVFSLLDFRTGEVAGWVLRTFLAGVFTYGVARAFGLGFAGAMLASVVFMFSGFHTSRKWLFAGHSFWVELPLILLAAERLVTRRKTWTIIWASVVIGVALLAGHYQLQFIALLMYAMYGAWRALAVGGGGRRLIESAARLALPVALGFALAAIQIWPSAELKTVSLRSGDGPLGLSHVELWHDYEDYRQRNSFIPYHLTMYALPFLYQHDDQWMWETYRGSVQEVFSYAGLLPLLLAPLAWRRRRSIPAVAPLIGIVVAFNVLSFGWFLPGYEWLVKQPGFGYFVYPSRYSFPAMLALGLLGGMGLEVGAAASREEGRRWGRQMLAAVVAIVALALIIVKVERLTLPVRSGMPSAAMWQVTVLERTAMSVPVIGLSLAVAWLLLSRRRSALVFAVLITAADLMSYWFLSPRGILRDPVPPKVLSAPSPWFDLIGPPGEWRIAGETTAICSRGYRQLSFQAPFMPRRCFWIDELNLRPYQEVAHLLRAYNVRYYYWHGPVEDDRLRELYAGEDEPRNLMHASRHTDWRLFECRDVLPRAFLVERAVWCANEAEARRRVEDTHFDAAREVVLEGKPPAGATPSAPAARRAPATRRAPAPRPAPAARPVLATRPTAEPLGECRIEAQWERGIRIRTDADTPAWLVLGDLFYPGWKAYVDGHETAIYAANYVCRGVQVPAGTHEVTFTYRARSWQWGRIITLGTLALLLLAAAGVGLHAARRRKGP